MSMCASFCFHRNEADVGSGIPKSGVARKDIFVVSKVYTSNHGYAQTVASVNASLERSLSIIHPLFIN